MKKNSYTSISFYWDALHLLLTGEPAGAPKEGHYLSEFIIGETIIGSEFYAACTTANTVKNIVEKINTIVIDNYLKDFSMAKLEKKNIYPKIWDDDSLKEDTIESLSRYFEDLRTFYNETAKNKAYRTKWRLSAFFDREIILYKHYVIHLSHPVTTHQLRFKSANFPSSRLVVL